MSKYLLSTMKWKSCYRVGTEILVIVFVLILCVMISNSSEINFVLHSLGIVFFIVFLRSVCVLSSNLTIDYIDNKFN